MQVLQDKSKYFSYWIFLWSLLYISDIIPYNPTFALLFAQLVMLIFLTILFTNYCIDVQTKIDMIISCILFKFIPLMVIWYVKDIRINTSDLYFTIGISILYSAYLYYGMNTTMYDIYMNIFIDYVCNKQK